MRTVWIGSAENYQVRASEEEPELVAAATERGLRRVARVAKAEAAKPRDYLWDKLLGPFLDLPQVARELGRPVDEVNAMTERRDLIALVTSDGATVYPQFQFDKGDQIRDQLAELFNMLTSAGADDWTAASWLFARQRDLDDTTVVDWLWADRDPERTRWLARDAARRFDH